MYKIKKTDLPRLYSRIAESRTLYLPVKSAGKTNFGVWTEAVQPDIEALKTVKSPKDIFFPQCETLYTVTREEGKMKLTAGETEKESFVVLGIRACDVRALKVLDQVFLSDPVDSFYAARREHGVLVSLACSRPETSCFCTTFGIDCAQPEGDIVTWLSGEYLYWQPQSEKGEAITASLFELLEAGEEHAVEEAKAEIHAICEKLPLRNLSLKRWGADAAKNNFDSPLWEQLYKGCLACGTCTFVCPTCQCYDIKDYTTGSGVQRYRCWDSCMYSDFTMMAHGNNRTSQLQRFRQRFMHKLAYFPANNGGMFSCVGCGRCVDKCPSHLNIVKVIRAFGKEEN